MKDIPHNTWFDGSKAREEISSVRVIVSSCFFQGLHTPFSQRKIGPEKLSSKKWGPKSFSKRNRLGVRNASLLENYFFENKSQLSGGT